MNQKNNFIAKLSLCMYFVLNVLFAADIIV